MRLARFDGGPWDGETRAIPDATPIEFSVSTAGHTAEPGQPLPDLVEDKRLGEYRKDPANPRRWRWHPEEGP